MTSFAFIFGLMPLWSALGAGAVARRLIGTVTIVGMVFSSGFAIFLVPVALRRRRAAVASIVGKQAAACIFRDGCVAGESVGVRGRARRRRRLMRFRLRFLREARPRRQVQPALTASALARKTQA